MTEARDTEKSPIWLAGDFKNVNDRIQVRRASVRERLGALTETTVEFLWPNKNDPLWRFLGKGATLHFRDREGQERLFTGTVISAEWIGTIGSQGHYVVELRPVAWVLTKTRDLRIFQEQTTKAIVDQIFRDAGLDAPKWQLSEAGNTVRPYCVQYRETDFAFVSRLLEQEGIYYYFDHKNSNPKKPAEIVMCDNHGSLPRANETLEYYERKRTKDRGRNPHIAEWARAQNFVSGEVKLNDFDYMSPLDDLTVSSKIPQGIHDHNKKEIYDYPGMFIDANYSKQFAKSWMQADVTPYHLRHGAGDVDILHAGKKFKIDVSSDEQMMEETGDFLVIEATHYMAEGVGIELEGDENRTGAAGGKPGEQKLRRDIGRERVKLPEGHDDVYSIVFTAMEVADDREYRSPKSTPWPRIPGFHTATVVGPSGEEIYTDEFGRIKVQFHWDREGQDDENSSCWVRVVTPWAGTGWGFVAVPRIGQEVVIQFQEGNPDRPMCTGMVYNGDNKPNYGYPSDKEMLGLRTNSSKGGAGFHELTFEDKAEQERVYFKSERDYKQEVLNNAEIEIGLTHNDPGDLTQTVYNNQTETIKEGNHTFTINKGDQTVTLDQGNQTTTVSTGNKTVNVSKGKITVTAKTSIEFVCGGSSIKMTPGKVEIKTAVVEVMTSGKATHMAGGDFTIMAPMVKIN